MFALLRSQIRIISRKSIMGRMSRRGEKLGDRMSTVR